MALNIRFQFMYYIYVLYSSKFNKFYTGFSQDIKKKLKEHNSGKTKSTKAFIPWKVIYTEECNSRIEALQKKYYKGGAEREKLKKLYKKT